MGGDDSKAKEPKELAEAEDNDEQKIDSHDKDQKTAIGVDFKQDDDSDTKEKSTESVIKRGVPKNTKPALAVVAIKMADLLTAPDDKVNHDQENTATANVSSSDHYENEIDNVKSKELLEKEKKEEKLKLEKELKQQEKLKKDEEAKAKKEKLKKEEEVRAKKEKAAEAKRLNDEKVDAEKQEKQQKQEHEAAKKKQ